MNLVHPSPAFRKGPASILLKSILDVIVPTNPVGPITVRYKSVECLLGLGSLAHIQTEKAQIKMYIDALDSYQNRFCKERRLRAINTLTNRYEHTPIQIHRKFRLRVLKRKIFRKKNCCFSYFCSKHRLWVLVRTVLARRF